MLTDGPRSVQSFFRVTESKRASQRENNNRVTDFQEPQSEFPCRRTSGCRWLPPTSSRPKEPQHREPRLVTSLCSLGPLNSLEFWVGVLAVLVEIPRSWSQIQKGKFQARWLWPVQCLR